MSIPIYWPLRKSRAECLGSRAGSFGVAGFAVDAAREFFPGLGDQFQEVVADFAGVVDAVALAELFDHFRQVRGVLFPLVGARAAEVAEVGADERDCVWVRRRIAD